MAFPIIATPSLSDVAVLTGGPVAGSMPLSNLQKQQPSRDATVFTDLTQVFWVWDLGAAYNINYAPTLRTNATVNATRRLRGADSIPHLTSAPGYDSTVANGGVALPFWPRTDLDRLGYSRFPSYLYSAAGLGTYRYWREDIVDAGNPAGYLQVGRAFLASTDSATLYTFPRGTAPGGMTGPRETPTRIETAVGGLFPTVNAKRVVEKFSVPAVSEADALGTIEAIQRTRGVSRAVVFSRDPGNAQYVAQKTVYGLLTIEDKPYVGWQGPTAVNGVHVAGSIIYTISGTIEEML